MAINFERELAIDIETYSPEDLRTVGVYKYAEHPEFEILLFAYSFDSDPVKIVDIASGEALPVEVRNALFDPTVKKTAFNALFERTCIDSFFSPMRKTRVNVKPFPRKLDIAQWRCTMVLSAMTGLPLSLDRVAKVLKLADKKDPIGQSLIRFFSIPCRATKTNNYRVRNFPEDDPEKWAKFKKYCIKDVVVEKAIKQKLAFIHVPGFEWDLYAIDQQINDRGVLIDLPFVKNAIQIDHDTKELLLKEAIEITGLDNPNSVSQLKEWIEAEIDEELDGLRKADLPGILLKTDDPRVERIVRIRQEMAKTSIKKYYAMRACACSDDRIRGLTQFYGANRTGRWSGRLVQMQNLPQNHLDDLALARSIVAMGRGDWLDLTYDNIPDTLSQLIRTAFIAKFGHTFIVCDFSAIEARVSAWLADEKWVMDVFAGHGRIYEATAAMMFHVPIESIDKHSPLRQRGKVAQLALGYQGSVGALTKMDTKGAIPEAEKKPLVDAWRNANPHIVQLWEQMNAAAFRAIKEGRGNVKHGVSFEYRGNSLYLCLPSGRRLCYIRAKIGKNRFGHDSITYEGLDQSTGKWCLNETYGGKLTENAVQAIARDCLAEAMVKMAKQNYEIVFHVHDETIIEYPEQNAEEAFKKVQGIMGLPISWAPGLLLKADGYLTKFYKKD